MQLLSTNVHYPERAFYKCLFVCLLFLFTGVGGKIPTMQQLLSIDVHYPERTFYKLGFFKVLLLNFFLPTL
jgi:hypothetical protein